MGMAPEASSRGLACQAKDLELNFIGDRQSLKHFKVIL